MSGTPLTRPTPTRRTRIRRAATVAATILAALALWTLTVPVAGLAPSAETGGRPQPIGAAAVVTATLAAGLAAWALLALLERTTARPRRTWTITALAVLALSLTGPLSSATDTESLLVLTALHLLVGAVLIPGLASSARHR
ncbi:DUF6069 family protein [Actinomadura bangladeshensis]|uniref:Uncharacterized protein n=1 Tax=Actinomadura bangladeshensis TaxID=453573 RepID=A0A6L9QT95_9ACTN|nr:DUF6069 family protein [Actinomadura bangladeshensis]NEA28162.1 hypothetical protein [Actinomadura bangladeshensis]